MRKFHEFNCPNCGNVGQQTRRVDLKRNCPWSIVLTMHCDECNHNWTTYERDESRITPFDFFDEDEEMSVIT